MKLPRDLSGTVLIKALCNRWNYEQIHQVGSHVILVTDTPAHQRIAIPNHPILRVGTLNTILRAIAEHKGVTKDEIVDTL